MQKYFVLVEKGLRFRRRVMAALRCIGRDWYARFLLNSENSKEKFICYGDITHRLARVMKKREVIIQVHRPLWWWAYDGLVHRVLCRPPTKLTLIGMYGQAFCAEGTDRDMIRLHAARYCSLGGVHFAKNKRGYSVRRWERLVPEYETWAWTVFDEGGSPFIPSASNLAAIKVIIESLGEKSAGGC